MKATVYLPPNGLTEVIDLTEVDPEDETWFTEHGVQISLEYLNGEFILYADLGQTTDEGEPEELIEFAAGRTCRETLAALRQSCMQFKASEGVSDA